MQRSDLSESTLLHDWVDENTRALDLVASWENLCETYDALRFHDPISDDIRLEEFKWIIKEMNKFLTRTKKTLMSCKDLEAAMSVLQRSFTPTGNITLENRRALAYHKLRQQWILMSISQMNQMAQELMMMEGETDGSGERREEWY